MRCLLILALFVPATTLHAQWNLGAALAPLHGQTAQAGPPHPAVVRIKVPESDGTAYGSGTLVDAREEYGLVLTNWHVVHAATGPIEVTFPSGFVSQARALKMDSEWDLAALVIWRPKCEPVRLATRPPRPGDTLTICGYGSGDYRAATGRCTQFYAPRLELPQELVELDVQARQGDSGGPIFNDRGQLAGVLFGAGQGTTLGSYEGRVKTFLTSLAPNIGSNRDTAPQVAMKPSGAARSICPTCPSCQPGFTGQSGMTCENGLCRPRGDLGDVCFGCDNVAERQRAAAANSSEWPQANAGSKPSSSWSAANAPGSSAAPTSGDWPRFESPAGGNAGQSSAASTAPASTASAPLLPAGLFENIRNVLALVGGLAILMQVLRFVG